MRLVTGGTGLVGSFVEADYKISSKDVDLRNFDKTLELFKKLNPKEVIHCAAKVGGVGGNMNHKGEFFYDNIMINTNILEICRLVDVEKVVSFLSTCIFPNKIEYPLTEDKIHEGEPHPLHYAYAYAKRMADIQTRAYREQYGLNYVCIVPTNIYGINDNFDIENGHVLPSLIHKCYLAKKNNEDFYVWGSGKPFREFIYNKDVAHLAEWALDNYNEKIPLIVSTGKEHTIKEVTEMIVNIMEFKGTVIWDSTKPDGQFRKTSSIERLKRYYPDVKFTPLREGLEETIGWFNKNYSIART